MRRVLAHGHIFKNAGTTLDWSLARSFGDNFLDHRDDRIMREHGTRHIAELVRERPGLTALSSHHLVHQLPQVSGVEMVPIYLLRHPLERIDSVYHFERRQQADTAGALAARRKSFRDYVAWRMAPGTPRTIRNYQTIYLAGVHNYSEDFEPGPGIFGTAMKTVRNSPLIGIVERYDESMVVIEHYLREALPALDLSYIRQNVTRRGWLRRDSSAASVLRRLGNLANTVVNNNSLDLALYQLVNRRLDDMIDRIEDFAARLGDFRSRCDALCDQTADA